MMNRILKKILPLLLSVAVAAGMNGLPLWAADSAGQENGTRQNGSDTVKFTVAINNGYPKAYYDFKDFPTVWKNLQGKTAEICLLESLDLEEITFDNLTEDNTHDDDNEHVLKLESGNITLEMYNNVELYNNNSVGIQLIGIKDGILTLKGGKLSVGTNGMVINVAGGNVNIENATLNGYTCISAQNAPSVKLGSNCILETKSKAVEVTNGYVNDTLANGFAYQKKNGTTGNLEWIKNGDNIKELTADTPGTVTTYKVEASPVKFDQHPKSITTITYGPILQTLHAYAEITRPEALDNHNISYQWYQLTEDGSWQETGSASQDFNFPEILHVGNYQYRCEATCDWFSLYSNIAAVTVERKTVTANIPDTIEKEYDGTTNILPEQLPSVQLDGIINSDIVTACVIKAFYDSPEPGSRTITAEIKLIGEDAPNYKLASNTISIPGRITGTGTNIPVTGVLLDRHTLDMTAGSMQQLTASVSPKNASNQTVSWTSNNPAVATVDDSGKVTAVSAGIAMITVATADGNYTDSCTVTVSSPGNGGGSGSGGSSGSGIGGSLGSIFINYNLPFVKGHPDKKGWTAIQQEAASVPEGGTAEIDMNGSVSVPGSFFTALRGRNITAVFDMGGGISWNVCGKDITAETFSNMNLSVRTGAGKIPQDVLNSTAGARAHLELSPVHSGAFGFTAVLTIQTCIGEHGFTIGTGKADAAAGMYANLFAYDPGQRSLTFICADRVGNDGTVHLPSALASDWTVILSANPMGGTDAAENPQEPEPPQEPEENTAAQVKSVKLSKTVYTYTGKAKKPAVTAVDTAGRQISDKYYTVSYQNNVKAGKAAAVVTFKNGYSGTVKKTFTIRPAGTSIKKATALSGGFTVKWAKKTAQTSGYQIQYSRNSGFKGSTTHSVFAKKASVTAKTVKKLSAGKKYYVRVRTYKTVKTDGKNTNIYSAWSSAAALRVK